MGEIRPCLTQRLFDALLLGLRRDQREGQNDKRGAGDRQRQIDLIETCASGACVKGAVSGKNDRSHRGVVHAGDGQAHHDRGTEPLPEIRGAECQPEGHGGRADRDDHREGNESAVMGELGVPPHGGHAGVVHRDDAESHEDPAEHEAEPRGTRATDDVEAAAGHEDRHHEG